MKTVADCRLIRFQTIVDSRGKLTIGGGDHVPFPIRHFFWIFDVPRDQTRGCHAHKVSQQIIVAVAGSCRVTLEDGLAEKSITLDKPQRGLYVPNGIWLTLRPRSVGMVLLVLCSHPYQPDDYIRDNRQFHDLTSRQ